MDAQSATNLLEDMVTESYFGMAMFSYFISGILVTLIPLSAIAKFYKPLANKSTQTDATTNTVDRGTVDDIEPQQDTYYGNDEIYLEAEKQKTYMKAVLDCYEDVTDQELKRTMKYLQRKRVTMIDAANFAKAIIYLRSHDNNMEDDDETAGQGREAAREELIKILIASGYEDAEDVVGRYERTYTGSVLTKDEFVDFYETLRGDLEKKLAREKVEKRKAEQEKMSLAEIKDQQIEEEKRKAEQEKRKAEMKDQQIEEEKRRAEQEKRNLAEMKDQQIEEEKRKAEQEKRKAEMKDQQIEAEKRKAEQEKRKAEQEKRKALDLEIQAQRSLCKICFTEEVGMLCLPCNHLYSCTRCADVVKQQGHCHMCYATVNTFLPISLS